MAEREIKNYKSCYFCGKDITFDSEKYIVKKAVEPPFTRNRRIKVGVACLECGEKNNTVIDPWKEEGCNQ